MRIFVRKLLTCLVIASLALVVVDASLAVVTYPSTYSSFQNSAYFSFNRDQNLTDVPSTGITVDSSFIGYWNMDEINGSLILNRNGSQNGTIYGAERVSGKYSSGLFFDGTNNDNVTFSSSAFDIATGEFSVFLWICKNGSLTERILGKGCGWGTKGYALRVTSSSYLQFFWNDGGDKTVTGTTKIKNNVWTFVGFSVNRNGTVQCYVNGEADGASGSINSTSLSNSRSFILGESFNSAEKYSGILDDLRFYNRSLSASDVLALYTLGPQPDAVSFSSYYNYTDSITDNTLLIFVSNIDTNNNSVIVSCTNFFVDNKLVFQANASAVINVWTNLGKPAFSTGVWNDRNYTTTLTVDASTTGELDWNRVPPSVSNLSTTSTYAGNTTIVSAKWRDNYSLSDGGYIFSTNNTGRWINSTWAPFSTNPDWGNFTLALNSTWGLTIGFREFANNTLNIWNASEIYLIRTTVAYTNTTSSSPTPSPTPSPTVMPSSNPTERPNTTTTPTSSTTDPVTQETIVLSIELIFIISTAIMTMIIITLVLAKKGHLTIEIVNDEAPEPPDDYSI